MADTFSVGAAEQLKAGLAAGAVARNARNAGSHRASGALRGAIPAVVIPVPWLALALSGCALSGAPSFVIAGAYFPGWMFCALIGIILGIVARTCFVVSGLAGILPFQLFVCTAIGLTGGLLAWFLWFGH